MSKYRFDLIHRMSLWLVLLSMLISTVAARADAVLPTNSYWRVVEADPAAYSDHPYRVSLFDKSSGADGARLWSQTKSVFFYGFGVIGVLVLLPESATGWDPDKDVFGSWIDNVQAGPVWDRDNWAYNYIGHTYCGGVYYQVARKSGFRQWDSFVYSALMSTFYWEYGIEAFAEIPSVQDLVVTPVMGWAYGEWAYQTELKIRDNNNELLGSGILGSTVLFILDPIDAFGRGVNHLVGRRWIKAGYGYFTYTASPEETSTDHTVMLNMVFPIGLPAGPSGPDADPKRRYAEWDDPVDSGVVGISVGGGYALFDKQWNVEDCYCRSVSLGLYFTPRFSSRLAYVRGDSRETLSGTDVIYENYSLDCQYYLNAGRRLRPYITGGVGELMWEQNEESNSFQVNAGLGLHWQFHPKWALNSDWINFFNTEYETYDQNINVGLTYRFGDGEHADW